MKGQRTGSKVYVCVQQVTPEYESSTGEIMVMVGGAYRATVYVDPEESPVMPDDIQYIDGSGYEIYVAPLGYDTKTGKEYDAVIVNEAGKEYEGFFMFLARLVKKTYDYREAQEACHLA